MADNAYVTDVDLCSFTAVEFDRNLQSLLHLPDAKGIRGFVIGRFQKRSEITEEKLQKIVRDKKELHGKPVLSNADIGHTDPLITFPIGGTIRLDVSALDSPNPAEPEPTGVQY